MATMGRWGISSAFLYWDLNGWPYWLRQWGKGDSMHEFGISMNGHVGRANGRCALAARIGISIDGYDGQIGNHLGSRIGISIDGQVSWELISLFDLGSQ
ncbi:unnamed protein product [Sphagnum balticum]